MPSGPDGLAPVRVALSNDYEIALLGLAQMLARHPDQVEVVELTTSSQLPRETDVILYDTFGRLPEDDEKLRQVVKANPDAKVVVYSWEGYPEHMARRHGAAGYLHKGLSADELVAAVVAIHDAERPAPAPGEDPQDRQVAWPGRDAGLSHREAEVLGFITRGLSNDEIARRSYLSINTVKSHIRSAYRKIGVTTRSQAVAWGYEHGFYSTSDVGP